jgi:predicted DNA-binding protein
MSVKRLTVSLPTEQVEVLEIISGKTGLAMSFLIRRAIKHYVETGQLEKETFGMLGDKS